MAFGHFFEEIVESCRRFSFLCVPTSHFERGNNRALQFTLCSRTAQVQLYMASLFYADIVRVTGENIVDTSHVVALCGRLAGPYSSDPALMTQNTRMGVLDP